MMARTELKTVTTDIPARSDRLPWSRWHWKILIGLGTVWILDGLEVTGPTPGSWTRGLFTLRALA